MKINLRMGNFTSSLMVLVWFGLVIAKLLHFITIGWGMIFLITFSPLLLGLIVFLVYVIIVGLITLFLLFWR